MEPPTSHTVPEDRLGELRGGVAKLNKRAAKLGMEPVVLVAGEPRLIVYTELLPEEYQESGRVPRTVERQRSFAKAPAKRQPKVPTKGPALYQYLPNGTVGVVAHAWLWHRHPHAAQVRFLISAEQERIERETLRRVGGYGPMSKLELERIGALLKASGDE